jgi:putative FmdB family regulatory protein
MPTYEYECPKCGFRFDKFEPMTAKPRGKCPECGAKCKRLLGPGAGIIFKGSGFHTTDYRSASYKKAAAKDAEAPAGGGSNPPAGKKEK